MELNPNHPATQAAHDHWHKVCALILLKLGLTEMTISPAEMDKLGDCNVNIAIRFDDTKGIELFIIDNIETAKIMARREGGLPV